jgi:hypothetical protein
MKLRYDLLSVHALRRLALLLERETVRYAERNWEFGQLKSPFLRDTQVIVLNKCVRCGRYWANCICRLVREAMKRTA